MTITIVWSKAVGPLYDIAGNKFIDFTSTIFVTNIGHSNSNLIKNLKKADKNYYIATLTLIVVGKST